MNSQSQDFILLAARAEYFRHQHEKFNRKGAIESAQLYWQKAQAKLREIEEPGAPKSPLYVNR